MRTLLQNLFKILFGAIEWLFPEKAARWAVKLFFTPIRHHRPEREQFFMKEANSQKIPFQPDIHKIYNPETANDLIFSNGSRRVQFALHRNEFSCCVIRPG